MTDHKLFIGPRKQDLRAKHVNNGVGSYLNDAIIVNTLADDRIDINVEVRNYGPNAVDNVTISVYAVECYFNKCSPEIAELLLRNIIALRAADLRLTNQTIHPCTPADDKPWQLPGGAFQVKIGQNYGGNYIVLAVLQVGDIQFLTALDQNTLSKSPYVGIRSTTQPNG